jgi:hypothetical protein
MQKICDSCHIGAVNYGSILKRPTTVISTGAELPYLAIPPSRGILHFGSSFSAVVATAETQAHSTPLLSGRDRFCGRLKLLGVWRSKLQQRNQVQQSNECGVFVRSQLTKQLFVGGAAFSNELRAVFFSFGRQMERDGAPRPG